MAKVSEKDLERRVEAVESQPPSLDDTTSSQELQTVDKVGTQDARNLDTLTEEEKKRVVRMLDFRLLPLLTFLYLVAFVDRSNSELYPFPPVHFDDQF